MSLFTYGMLLLQAITLLTIGWMIKQYFPSYFSEKGKNLATKEDIGRITAEVEKVRLVYATDLETTKNELQRGIERTRHDLSLALEASNRYENLRVQAYVDFVRAVGGLAVSQRNEDASEERRYSAQVAEAKVRIAIYGSKEVAEQLGYFFAKYGALTSQEAMLSFMNAIQQMREESVLPSEQVETNVIGQLLF
ncbi:hypothetical protein [Silvibacterium acidisoli]|uniref:hypothetical protein n=1 Tax=Acidobacteriaceae bacterium ZG23-2 TaxID=2883246 RepID=UPI00406CED1C